MNRSMWRLFEHRLLAQTVSSRGVVCHTTGKQILGPKDMLDSLNSDLSSPNLAESSLNLDPSSPNLTESSPNSERVGMGRFVTESQPRPIVDNWQVLKSEYLEEIANEPRQKAHIPPDNMRNVPSELTANHYITSCWLAECVDQDPETIRGQHPKKMVKDGALGIAFPQTPNDPHQAYIPAGTLS